MALNLSAYFKRIGFEGSPMPTLKVLKVIHQLHPATIPFENLNPFLGRPVKLDLDSIQDKMVNQQRGGYCFEHNSLLKAVLEAIGFSVRSLAARVLWNQPEDSITPRSHMLLLVKAEGDDYLVDVGFGGQTQTAPLRFVSGIEQRTPTETFRIVELSNSYHVQSEVNGYWRTLYRFDLSEQFHVDFEVTNHFLSTHPSSHFVTALIAARTLADRRYALLNNRFTTHSLNGKSLNENSVNKKSASGQSPKGSEVVFFDKCDQIIAVLEQKFGIIPTDREQLIECINRKGILEPESKE